MLAFLISLPFLGPAHKAHAETADMPANGTAGNAASLVCAKIDASNTELDQLLSNSEMKYAAAQNARQETLLESRKESDAALLSARKDADATYAAQFANLMAGASTKAEKKAVLAFEKSVNQAVSARRAAVDAAIKAYRDGVDGVIAARAQTYGDALAALKTSIDTKLASKKSDCLQNPPTAPFIASIRAQADLGDARSNFKSKIASLDKNAADLDALAAARDGSVNKAEADFQASIQTAAAVLKVVFGNK